MNGVQNCLCSLPIHIELDVLKLDIFLTVYYLSSLSLQSKLVFFMLFNWPSSKTSVTIHALNVVQVLLKMLPHYYSHVQAYDNTLITKFFGAHRIALRHGKKVFHHP